MHGKICNTCKQVKYPECFGKLKRNLKKGTVYYTKPRCNTCESKRVKQWAMKNTEKRLAYESLRSTFKGRATPVCAHCKQGNNLVKCRIDKWTALYHTKCVEELYAKRNEISPLRKAYLLKIASE